MKFLTLLLVFFFSFSLPNTALAIVYKNTDNVSSPALTTVKKPNFMQKWALKHLAQKLDTTKVYQKAAVETQGDKLANIGFSSSLAGIASLLLLFLMALNRSFNSGLFVALLGYLGFIAILVGLIISIIALTANDITPPGKVKAGWGVGLIGIFLLLFVIVINTLYR
jgi:hypothetical protein